MKNKKIIVGVCLFLLLAVFLGCQDQANQANEEEIIEENDQIDEVEADNEEDETNDTSDSDAESEIPDDEATETNGELDDETFNEKEKEALYEINQSTWSVEPITDDTNEQVVLLTIDDVPDNYGLEMAHILADLDAPAIFFVNGHFIQTEEKQAMLKEIHDLGFAIGNHTYTHPVLSDISEAEQRQEIVELNDLIEDITGERPKFFRAPHGVNTDYSTQVVAEEGMVMMNWTYGYDYFEPYMDKDKLAEAMITGEGPEVDVNYSLLKPGANLLMHDREWTKDALEQIVTGLREQGYEMVDPDLIRKIDE